MLVDAGGYDDVTITGFTHVPFDPTDPANPSPPPGASLPYGLFSFEITGLEPGASVTVTLELPGPAHEYWKLQNGSWSPLTNATFEGNTVTFTLTDGGVGDASNSANGTIVDPGAPVLRAGFTG